MFQLWRPVKGMESTGVSSLLTYLGPSAGDDFLMTAHQGFDSKADTGLMAHRGFDPGIDTAGMRDIRFDLGVKGEYGIKRPVNSRLSKGL